VRQNAGYSRAAQFIIISAALVVVIAGMREAAPLLIPFLLSVFISILCLPAMQALKNKGVPESLAIVLVILLVFVIGTGVVLLVGSSVDDFSRNLPTYENRVTQQWSNLLAWLGSAGIALPQEMLISHFDPRSAMQMARTILTGFGNVLANSFLIMLTVIFILLEAGSFARKLKMFNESGSGENTSAEFVAAFTQKVRDYMSIKTWMSLLTGVLVALSLWLLGVD